jgi:hypothetical protein
LKTFQEGNKTLFDTEKAAFNTLSQAGGMVQCLASYEHEEPYILGNASNVTDNSHANVTDVRYRATHNILLEFGESDLDVFFGDRLPPVLQTEVEEFWKALFEVVDAVADIHDGKTDTGGVFEEFEG